MRTRIITLLVALSLVACQGEEEKPAEAPAPAAPAPEEPTEPKEKSPEAESSAEPADSVAKATPAPTLDVEPGDVEVGPPALTLAEAAGSENYAIRIGLNMKPFVDAGLHLELIERLPPSARDSLNAFVGRTSFDPWKQIKGLAVLSPVQDLTHVAKPQDLLKERSLVLFFAEGTISEELIQAMRQSSGEGASDKQKTARPIRSAVFATLTPENLDSMRAQLEQEIPTKKDDATRIVHPISEQRFVRIKHTDTFAEYVYFWPGGMLRGEVATSQPIQEAVLEALALDIGELNALEGSGSGALPFIQAVAPIMGNAAALTVDITDSFTLEATIPVDPKLVSEVGPFIKDFESIKRDPSPLLTQVPPPLVKLAKLAVQGAEVRLDGTTIHAKVQMPLSDMKAALPPASAFVPPGAATP